jgi:two-component system NarL family response regulator
MTRVVVLTISDQDADVMTRFAGACGYCSHASIQDVMRGIQSAAVGQSLISPTIAAKVLERVRAATASPTLRRPSDRASERRSGIKLIANGKDNETRRPAHQPEDGQNHISNILMKLHRQPHQAAVCQRRSQPGIAEKERSKPLRGGAPGGGQKLARCLRSLEAAPP